MNLLGVAMLPFLTRAAWARSSLMAAFATRPPVQRAAAGVVRDYPRDSIRGIDFVAHKPRNPNSVATSRRFASTVDSTTVGDVTTQSGNDGPKKGRGKKGTFSSDPPPDPSTFPEWSYHKSSEAFNHFRFELIHQSKKSMARVGRIHTPHGVIDTPGFVAVATNGALKGLDTRDADKAGQQLIFCNTYHLLLQPGPDVVEGAGGLHSFMNRRDGPLITDSGGFQVFSLAYGSVQEELSSGGELKRAKTRSTVNGGRQRRGQNSASADGGPPVKVTEEGVTFKSYRDGRKIVLTPESTVQVQKALGADIIIPLDELPPYHTDRERLVQSVDLTHRWEARSLREHLKDVRKQAMYCVVHGGIDVELRTKSVEYLTSLPFDGYAIGGSLGKNREELADLLSWMMPLFDKDGRRDKPRHLLGIADEENILSGVTRGVDTFDSCYPTRLARHGTLLTREGTLNIKSGSNSKAYGVPPDPECNCSTCRHYDRPYLWHLYKAKEPLFMQLAAVHNVQYMNDLMARHRQDILDGKI
uniref:tRNA-guanine(15) transglycosylase-like domain-containing protein n=1 Tax=Odontella aurita TaxID=265563 RepID=A0A7S4K6U2_9STRA|mmetsp:Transcript_62974/g.185994  ORF Transcript_62974/g.185994 Transcript_62974/m.185994 type:complete len:528 (+) Transcript_62974:369-1952(+)